MLTAFALLFGAFLLPTTTWAPTLLLNVILWGNRFLTLLGQASTVAASSLLADDKLRKSDSGTGRAVRNRPRTLGFTGHGDS